MNIKNSIEAVHDKINDMGARAMVAATNAAGRAMNTKLGRAALVLPAAVSMCTLNVHAAAKAEQDIASKLKVSMCTLNVHAAGDGADAQGMIDAIMGILGPGVIGLGSLVAVVGGIQTGVGFKDDNADGKTRGFQTLIGGAIIAAVGAIVPSTISLGGS